VSPWISVHLLQTQSDERLLAAAREGHERAFEALVQRYRRPLLRYCRRMLLTETAADDALQQGLLQAWLALQRGTEVRDARAWLYRVVHNAAVDALRSSAYDHEQLNDSLQGATAPHSDLERRIAVRQALAGLAALPELQRAALLRTAIEGHSHEEVAAALGLSDGSVRGLIYRARATLRASATAITPTPVVAWMADLGPRAAPLAERLGGAGAGGGDAGGALLKGGVAVLTAGTLVAGAVAVHPHAATRAHHRGPRTASYQAARANDRDAGTTQSPAANPSSARDRASTSGIRNARHASAGRTSAPFNRAEGTVRELRLAASLAPAHRPAHRGPPAFQGGSSAGKPRSSPGNIPSRDTVPATPTDLAIGRSPGSPGPQGVDDSYGPSRVPTGQGYGGQRDSHNSNAWSDAGSGPATDSSAGGSGSAHPPDAEASSGSTGASGPSVYGSNGPDVARAASTGPGGSTGATPRSDN
jgi:RNA polymerase sigma factor (sigma-70 family)